MTEDADAVLTIDIGALVANFRALRDLAAPAVCAAVVKADAYGLGMDRVAPALAAAGCGHFFVALPGEGVRLRTLLGPAPSIYVLHGVSPGSAARFVAHELIPVLNSLGQAHEWCDAALAERVRLPAVLQVDSGMGRLGLPPGDIAELPDLSALDLRLVMSHLACADTPAHPANAAQLSAFAELRRRLPAAPASLAASKAIFLGRAFHFDMVRPGGSLYGLAPCAGANPMRPVVGLRARVIQTRRIAPGAPVGYGHIWHASGPATIATVAIGYADGFGRAASASSAAWFGDERLPVAGRISMDSTTLDATGSAVREGDWLEILGPHRNADALAEAAGTTGWEVLARLGRRFARAYVTGED